MRRVKEVVLLLLLLTGEFPNDMCKKVQVLIVNSHNDIRPDTPLSLTLCPSSENIFVREILHSQILQRPPLRRPLLGFLSPLVTFLGGES